MKTGVPSAFIIEATFEDSNTGNIHSGRDKLDQEGFSFDHMAQFARLSLGKLSTCLGSQQRLRPLPSAYARELSSPPN